MSSREDVYAIDQVARALHRASACGRSRGEDSGADCATCRERVRKWFAVIDAAGWEVVIKF